jgi:hypothetical protein
MEAAAAAAGDLHRGAAGRRRRLSRRRESLRTYIEQSRRGESGGDQKSLHHRDTSLSAAGGRLASLARKPGESETRRLSSAEAALQRERRALRQNIFFIDAVAVQQAFTCIGTRPPASRDSTP